jgi:hypothetical protein
MYRGMRKDKALAKLISSSTGKNLLGKVRVVCTDLLYSGLKGPNDALSVLFCSRDENSHLPVLIQFFL